MVNDGAVTNLRHFGGQSLVYAGKTVRSFDSSLLWLSLAHLMAIRGNYSWPGLQAAPITCMFLCNNAIDSPPGRGFPYMLSDPVVSLLALIADTERQGARCIRVGCECLESKNLLRILKILIWMTSANEKQTNIFLL